MNIFLLAAGVVALAEIGDKTQLLALLLAARFRRPWPIVAGILVATLANHAFAGTLGVWLAALAGPQLMRWVLGASFLGMAGWMLFPDSLEAGDRPAGRYGVFGTTVVTFFMAEMGDKTQIATLALAARYEAVVAVVLGTTVGLMLANVPAVFLGNRMAHRVPVRAVQGVAAAIFAALGVATLLGLGAGAGV